MWSHVKVSDALAHAFYSASAGDDIQLSLKRCDRTLPSNDSKVALFVGFPARKKQISASLSKVHESMAFIPSLDCSLHSGLMFDPYSASGLTETG